MYVPLFRVKRVESEFKNRYISKFIIINILKSGDFRNVKEIYLKLTIIVINLKTIKITKFTKFTIILYYYLHRNFKRIKDYRILYL